MLHHCELCFSSFSPSNTLPPGCYSPGIEFLQAYTKRAELVYAYMGILGNDTHMSSSPLLHTYLINPPPRCPLPRSSVVPRLPMSLTQAPGAQVRARCCGFPCLGHRNGAHKKNETWAERRSWMAAACWVYTTMNRMMVSLAGGGFDRRHGRGGTCGENVYMSFWVAI